MNERMKILAGKVSQLRETKETLTDLIEQLPKKVYDSLPALLSVNSSHHLTKLLNGTNKFEPEQIKELCVICAVKFENLLTRYSRELGYLTIDQINELKEFDKFIETLYPELEISEECFELF